MKKIENIYTLKPIYDGKPGCIYTGTYMSVDEFWNLLNDFMHGVNELKRFTLRDKIQFAKDADRLWPAAICFLHPEIEGIVGEKTPSYEELYKLLEKLQKEDCEERCGRSRFVENLKLLNFSFITRKKKQMKKIENIYMLKPIYDGKSGCFYTGTYMPVDELWDLLNDFMYGVDELKRFTLRDKIQFSKDAERLWTAAICFLHPEIEGIVGEKTLADVGLYELLEKLQKEDCEESEKSDDEEDEE